MNGACFLIVSNQIYAYIFKFCRFLCVLEIFQFFLFSFCKMDYFREPQKHTIIFRLTPALPLLSFWNNYKGSITSCVRGSGERIPGVKSERAHTGTSWDRDTRLLSLVKRQLSYLKVYIAITMRSYFKEKFPLRKKTWVFSIEFHGILLQKGKMSSLIHFILCRLFFPA